MNKSLMPARMKRTVAAFSLAMATATALTGCAFSEPNTSKAPDKGDASAAPAEALCDPADDSYGDVVPAEPVTDEAGTYCHVMVNPHAVALTNETPLSGQLLNEQGVSPEQAKNIQRKAITFTAGEFFDSNILDRNSNGVEGNDGDGVKWLEEHKDDFDPGVLANYQKPGEIYKSNVVFNGYSPTLIRDGKPRITDSSIRVVQTYAQADSVAGQPANIVVLMEVAASYRATDQEAVVWQMREDSEETLRTQSPELFDGEGENNLVLAGKVAYSYSSATEKLLGNSFELDFDYSPTPGLTAP
jgi:hypothetical protein